MGSYLPLCMNIKSAKTIIQVSCEPVSVWWERQEYKGAGEDNSTAEEGGRTRAAGKWEAEEDPRTGQHGTNGSAEKRKWGS